jgi:chemotaxis protein CheZ
MSVNRKRFRIEQAILGDAPIVMPAVEGGEIGPMHREIMAELRAIRAQMASVSPGRPVAADATVGIVAAEVNREVADAQALLETYRAQIEQCEKLKVELDLIHDAINRTKREIATLHGTSYDGQEMSKVNGELGAVVGGTEQATQTILQAAEEIDQAAATLSAVLKGGHDQGLAQEIQDRVVQIFEACNFQDLTGQRVGKVMATLRFVEDHVARLIEIWQGIERFRPIVLDEPPKCDAHLSGPKLPGDEGHSTQNDIDAMFGCA